MRGVLFFLLIVVLAGGVVFVERRPLLHIVAQTGMLKSMFARSTIKLPHISGANSYNIYYSQAPASSFAYSVRNISPNDSSYTITYLRKNVAYEYKISALDKSGKEIWWSKADALPDVQPM